jgi:hypothetical protein
MDASANESLFDAIAIYSIDAARDAIERLDADVDACVSTYTPLTLALELPHNKCRKPIIELLLASGANVHVANAWGGTPLLSAIATGQLGWAREFARRGADVNVLGFVGSKLTSPIHEAAYLGHELSLRFLIEAGADPDMHGPRRRRPMDYARGNLALEPRDLARVLCAIDHTDAKLGVVVHTPVDSRHMLWTNIDNLVRCNTNWQQYWIDAMKKKDWANALMAAEMGAIVSTEVMERLRVMRVTPWF